MVSWKAHYDCRCMWLMQRKKEAFESDESLRITTHERYVLVFRLHLMWPKYTCLCLVRAFNCILYKYIQSYRSLQADRCIWRGITFSLFCLNPIYLIFRCRSVNTHTNTHLRRWVIALYPTRLTHRHMTCFLQALAGLKWVYVHNTLKERLQVENEW